jgi:hypothetical protein
MDKYMRTRQNCESGEPRTILHAEAGWCRVWYTQLDKALAALRQDAVLGAVGWSQDKNCMVNLLSRTSCICLRHATKHGPRNESELVSA